MVHVPAMAIAAPLLAFSIYRRVRRNISRQKLSEWRLWMRSGFLLLAFAALLRWPVFDGPIALAMCAGAASGVLLSRFGVQHTRFEQQADGQYYTPNLILGTAISLIFVARMGYRLIMIYPALQAASAQGATFSPQTFFAGSRSAMTMALLGLVIGYFVGYCLGVLQRAKQLRTAPHVPAAA